MKIAGTVLVGSDLSPASDEAIRQAAALARREDAALVACHVLPGLFAIRPLFPELREQDREVADRLRDWAVRALEEQLRRAQSHAATRSAVRIEAGSAPAVLLDVASEIGAGLIVLGRGADGRAGPSRGVAASIARHARCPVMVISAHGGDAILAATDFSDPALPAIRAGQAEADRRGLPLIVVHAVDVQTSRLTLPEIVSPSFIGRVIEARRIEARGRLAQLAEDLGPNTRILLREGPAEDEIVAAADETRAALIIVGTHGRSGLSRLGLGSVAEGVLRRARRSILVVRLAT